jgi:hypothetical protein
MGNSVRLGRIGPVATTSSPGAESSAQFADIADVAPITAAQGLLLALGAKATVSLTTVGSPGGTATLATVPGMASKTVTEMGGLAAVAAYVSANSSVDCTLVGTAITFTAKAYGTALNGTSITGTLLSAPGTLAGGEGARSAQPLATVNQALTTPTIDGELSSATKQARLTAIAATAADGGWFDAQINLFKVAAPGVSVFRTCDFSTPGRLPTGLVDNNQMGGGASSSLDDVVHPLTSCIVNDLLTQMWAFSFRASIPVPVTSVALQLGFIVPIGGSPSIGTAAFSSYYDLGVDSRTKLTAYFSGNTWALTYLYGPVINAGVHTYTLAHDVIADTVKLYVDGALSATLDSASSHLPAGTGRLQIQASIAAYHYITDLAWAV